MVTAPSAAVRRQLKVVYVSTLRAGGPVSHLRDLAPAVAEEDVDVRVICGDRVVAADFERLGIPASVVSVDSKYDVRGAGGLARSLGDADVIHTHDRRAGLFGRVAGRLRGSRVVHTLHGIPEDVALALRRSPDGASPTHGGVRGRATLRAESLLARLGLVITPSQALADFVCDRGFPRARVRVVPHGIAVRRHVPAPRHRPAVVGTAATLDHHKGIDILLTACARIAEPLQVEIFGDGSARPELEQLAQRLGVRATFHGFVDDFRDRIPGLDVFVLPTRGDNSPLAILEAMADAVPVVATLVGGIPELVRDGETGVLVPADDPAALADALHRVLDSEDLRTQLAAAGARRAERDFGPADAARRTVAVYQELLS